MEVYSFNDDTIVDLKDDADDYVFSVIRDLINAYKLNRCDRVEYLED